MGKIVISISDKTEEELRSLLRRKGDLSRIVEQAIKVQLNKEKGGGS